MVGIADFLLAAEAVLGIDAERIARATRISLAESALAAPFASFEGNDLYTDPVQRAAIIASRLVRNHPLPDGNRRVALLLMDMYLEEQGLRLTANARDIDRTFRDVAAGRLSEADLVIWLRSRAERI
ncbi:MAG TPA: Fic family protein [Solirubrobacteraceae bacterium]|nr:Fic family protein [Solirubrobacteraceae bacterium]